MLIISELLKFIGIGWILLAVTIGVLGGEVTIKIKNPITKKSETITEMQINKTL